MTLLQRVAGTSVQEIDGLIAELQTLRALLQEEGERVQRNLARFSFPRPAPSRDAFFRLTVRASIA